LFRNFWLISIKTHEKARVDLFFYAKQRKKAPHQYARSFSRLRFSSGGAFEHAARTKETKNEREL
jgi:hypothetical protein